MAASPGWQTQLLKLLRAPATAENLRFLDAWQRAEGGAARFNPLNTTQRAPGATSYNSVGVRNYMSPLSGLQATAATLLNGRYGSIVGGLRSGHESAVDLARDEAGTPWGTGAGILRVLGAGGQPAAAPSPTQAVSAPTMPAPAPQVDTAPLRAQALQALIGQVGKATPDESGFFGALKNLRGAETQNQAKPQLKVQVEPGAAAGHGAVAAVKLAEKYLGTDYHWGGDSPATGFDCSGLLHWALGQEGIKIPRTTYDQFKTGTPVPKNQLAIGDAVFFEPTKAGPGHVGIYVGNGSFLEAPHTGAVVRISKLAGRTDYVGARRYQ